MALKDKLIIFDSIDGNRDWNEGKEANVRELKEHNRSLKRSVCDGFEK